MYAKPFCSWDFYLNKNVISSSAKCGVGSYILLSPVFFGQSFVKSEKNVGFSLGMINNSYIYRGECLQPTNRRS